jgi:lysophospholipase L1-like esterase
MKKSFGYYIYLSIIVLLALEILLRIFGINETYSESIGQSYQSYFNIVSKNYYQTWRSNDTFVLDHKDFKYNYITNEIGLREISIDSFKKKSSDTFRILTLGDSFTEGVGAPYDSTFPYLLEKKLQLKNLNCKVYNAGASGSDPFFNYVFYKDKLKNLNPHLIIIAINSSDINDYFFRGGMERFQNNFTVKTKKGPRYETLYKHSYIFRLLIVNILRKKKQMFISDAEYKTIIKDFSQDFLKLMSDFEKKMGDYTCLLIVAFPAPSESKNSYIRKNIIIKKTFEQLLSESQSNNIYVKSLFPEFNALINKHNFYDFTFKNDGHFNSNGYEHFASYLLPGIDSLIRFKETQSN